MTKGPNRAPYWLDDNEPTLFPGVGLALTDPDGLLAIGGDLSIERLSAAYKHGIFPWYSEGQPILWWSPDPRAVLRLDNLVISRSLGKVLRNTDYQVSFDTDFAQVVSCCAQSRKDGLGTWILDEMSQAYCELHTAGIAHSVEVWHKKELVGGLYGVSFGGVFFGESMFSRQSNGSKIALVYLVTQLKKWGFGFVDAQIYSAHLGTLGVTTIARTEFIQQLNIELKKTSHIGTWRIENEVASLLKNE